MPPLAPSYFGVFKHLTWNIHKCLVFLRVCNSQHWINHKICKSTSYPKLWQSRAAGKRAVSLGNMLSPWERNFGWSFLVFSHSCGMQPIHTTLHQKSCPSIMDIFRSDYGNFYVNFSVRSKPRLKMLRDFTNTKARTVPFSFFSLFVLD